MEEDTPDRIEVTLEGEFKQVGGKPLFEPEEGSNSELPMNRKARRTAQALARRKQEPGRKRR